MDEWSLCVFLYKIICPVIFACVINCFFTSDKIIFVICEEHSLVKHVLNLYFIVGPGG